MRSVHATAPLRLRSDAAGPLRAPTADIGFWSAAVAAAASTLFTLAAIRDMTGFIALARPWYVVSSLAPSLVLAPAFLIMLVSLNDAVPAEKRIWTRVAVALACVYVPLCTTAYVLEMLVVQPLMLRQDQPGAVALLTLTRGGTMLNDIDGLGYGFMSLATLFAWPAFGAERLQRWIGWLFLGNGVVGIPVLLTYFVSPAFIAGAALWGITIPASTILLAVFFRREGKGRRCVLAAPGSDLGAAEPRPRLVVEDVT